MRVKKQKINFYLFIFIFFKILQEITKIIYFTIDIVAANQFVYILYTLLIYIIINK